MSSFNDLSPADQERWRTLLYGYVPTESVTIIFIALFSISTILHIEQSFFFRTWWLLPTVCLCGVMEILGWSARIWSSFSPIMQTPYLIQITATILAPTPLLAANFVILGRIILSLGPAYSRLSPMWYAVIFSTCDVVALVVQAVGGAIASLASESNHDPMFGGRIMLGGITFQLVTITIFAFCALEFFVRVFKERPLRALQSREDDGSLSNRGRMDNRLKFMIIGLTFSTLFIFIRAIYRTIELADGWNGRIIRNEVYFNVLDGAMVILAMYTLNVAHPAVLLGDSQYGERGHLKQKERPARSLQSGSPYSSSFIS